MKKNHKASISVHLGMQGVTSGISITLVLILIGMIVISLLSAQNLSTYIKENISFSIYVDPEMKEADIIKMQNQLRKEPFVKELHYISAEQALKEQTNELGIDPTDFLGYNPYTPMLEVKLAEKYANTDSLRIIEKRIKRSNVKVTEVMYQEELIQSVNHNIRFIAMIMVGLAVLFGVISFALINNTMRLAVYSKRFLIHTMRLVGAGWGFIRRPFVFRCMGMGLLAGLIACILLVAAVWWLNGYEPGISLIITPQVMGWVCATVMVSGVVITGLSALLSINSFLRMKGNQMFHI